jgi:hypothetical protein
MFRIIAFFIITLFACYIWGFVFYSHVENTCMTAPFHWKGRFGPIKLSKSLHIFFIELSPPMINYICPLVVLWYATFFINCFLSKVLLNFDIYILLINARINRRAIENGQFRETGNIWHTIHLTNTNKNKAQHRKKMSITDTIKNRFEPRCSRKISSNYFVYCY